MILAYRDKEVVGVFYCSFSLLLGAFLFNSSRSGLELPFFGYFFRYYRFNYDAHILLFT
jgi:hypothetical protein